MHLENPAGVIVQHGGQTPLKLARALEAADAHYRHLADSIDLAEDRERFQKLIERLNLKQPPNRPRARWMKPRCANEIAIH